MKDTENVFFTITTGMLAEEKWKSNVLEWVFVFGLTNYSWNLYTLAFSSIINIHWPLHLTQIKGLLRQEYYESHVWAEGMGLFFP